MRELLTTGMVLATSVAMAADDPLAAYRWKARVVVIAALRADDPRLQRQRAELAFASEGVRERQIVVVEAVADGAVARRLRAHLDLGDAAFRVVLVGKDGTAKRSSDRSLTAAALFELIDTMPMRRDEMRR